MTTPEGRMLKSCELSDDLLKSCDCVVITTNHSSFNIKNIVEKSNSIVDLRNAVKDYSEKVYKL